ncbi:hypothetical protein BDP27DRAFT_1369878 [Rhodocollybia butyracea]|uniref:Uncharacterized protein n=1 Tax=Rhodocollybia butyracea TaxID=206335 RepID=A0A9P5PDI5_9AGAR|nr:hypothetical protein BDP27DRAFT_1369878 [Rhodocollybia butyracea]
MQLKVLCLYLLATLTSTSTVCAAPPGQRPPITHHSTVGKWKFLDSEGKPTRLDVSRQNKKDTDSTRKRLALTFPKLKEERTGADVHAVLGFTSYLFQYTSVPPQRQVEHKYVFELTGGTVCVPSCIGWYSGRATRFERMEIYYPTLANPGAKYGVMHFHQNPKYNWGVERRQFFDAVKPVERWSRSLGSGTQQGPSRAQPGPLDHGHDKEKCFECLCADPANPPGPPHEAADWSHLDIKPHQPHANSKPGAMGPPCLPHTKLSHPKGKAPAPKSPTEKHDPTTCIDCIIDWPHDRHT